MKCKSNHGWGFLNKRWDDKESTIVCFCDECGWIDPEALRLQKAEDKARLEYDQYKAQGMMPIWYPKASKRKDN